MKKKDILDEINDAVTIVVKYALLTMLIGVGSYGIYQFIRG